jgi:hypothetical protein
MHLRAWSESLFPHDHLLEDVQPCVLVAKAEMK